MLTTLVSKEDNICIVKLIGELDIATADSFKDTIEKELKNIKGVSIDFMQLEFVDSTGIGALIEVIRNIQGKEISFKIYNINQDVFEVLDLLGIPELFGAEIFEKV